MLEAESTPQGHSVAGRIMSMKNFDDTIGNRTRDLPVCSTVPRPTAPPRAPEYTQELYEIASAFDVSYNRFC